jgi:hypothetical protein
MLFWGMGFKMRIIQILNLSSAPLSLLLSAELNHSIVRHRVQMGLQRMWFKMAFRGMWFKMQIKPFNSVQNAITKHVIQNAISRHVAQNVN